MNLVKGLSLKKNKYNLTGVLLLLLSLSCFAQKTAIQTEPYPSFRNAGELFQKEKYASAQHYFNLTIDEINNPNHEIRVHSEYYAAVCALKLFNKDSEYLLKEFVKKHPDSQWLKRVYFQLGNYNYQKKKYKKVIQYFKEVSPRDLSKAEQTEYSFKIGYSHLQLENKKDALVSFYSIKDEPSNYYDPSNYYYAHLNYEDGKYQAALESFQRIDSAEGFQDIIPYYIAHIYHQQKKYDELISYATPLLENYEAEKKDDIERLLGEAYYHRKEYSKALPYLEKYAKGEGKRTHEDNYQLGFCYMQNNELEKATVYLSFLSNEDNELGQTANYHLGDIYLKLKNKSFARNAYRAAAKLPYKPSIKEDAMYNYAKLAYELSYNPYHEAISAFEDYQNSYPHSEKRDEINEYLIQVYLTTRNYKAALESLDKIKNKDFRLKSAYQYIAYNRAVELTITKKYDQALQNFERVFQHNFEPKFAALANYWKAEIYYQQGLFGKSIAQYKKFLDVNGAYNSGRYDDAYYGMAYAHFKQEHIPEALSDFRTYAAGKSKKDSKKLTDAYLRIADCFFVSKSYTQAISYYSKGLETGRNEADYALLQRAKAKGFSQNHAGKVTDLKKLLTDYPDTKLLAEAQYEIADAYFKENRNEEALAEFDNLINNYPNSPYVRNALLSKGLLLYRAKKYDEAIATFKNIAVLFPNFEDAKEAIARVEDISVEQGKVEEFNVWAKSLTFVNITDAELDSVNYRAAENIYTNGNCDNAIEAMQGYLAKFDPPAYGVNAHFYLADCFYKNKDVPTALEYYQQVLSYSKNKFTEEAYVNAAYLNYKQKNYETAVQQYRDLEKIATTETNLQEAIIGQLRCYNQLENNGEVVRYSARLIDSLNVPEKFKLEAYVFRARAYLNGNKLDSAQNNFKKVAALTQTEEAAEARYNVAYISFVKQKYKQAEDEVFEVVNMQPSYDYWLAKAFILLGDVYIAQNDNFQAKATFQSVVDNHDGIELNTLAKQKLQKILDAEAILNKGKEDTLKIEMEGYEEKYEQLFEEIPVDTSSQETEILEFDDENNTEENNEEKE